MNVLEQQASNRRRTWLVLGLFVALFVAFGYGFDRVYLGARDVPVPIGAMIALGAGSASAMAGYYRGDRAVLLSSGAMAVDDALAAAVADDDRLKISQFDHVVEEMAIAAGLPTPKAYVVPDADPNAFATGRDPAHASVAVTTGLLESAETPTVAVKRGSAHLCIADPLGRRIGLREGRWADLMATHPPMANRIAALREMAYQQAGRPARA